MNEPNDSHELPHVLDLDDLPPALAEHPGPFVIEGVHEDGNVWGASVTREAIAAAFADKRRLEDDDGAA